MHSSESKQARATRNHPAKKKKRKKKKEKKRRKLKFP